MMSVFCSNSLLHAPECGKCILRDPNFQNFPGEHAPATPLEARALQCALKTPAASFSISPPTSQILPSTPFLIENPVTLFFFWAGDASFLLQFSKSALCCCLTRKNRDY